MKKGQTSVRGGYEDILCPFTNLSISQGSGYMGGTYSHQGLRAIDVVNGDGSRASYYAPFDCKAVNIITSAGQTIWQSLNKVRFADGTIDYATVLTVHDNSINFGIGYVAKQGTQFGNMGNAGQATGIHCHIEFAKGHQGLVKNSYGNWGLSNSVEFEQACFMDNTNIISGVANWKYLKDVPVSDKKYLNLAPTISSWAVYKTHNYFISTRESDIAGRLNPKKFGGLSYEILKDYGDYHFKIQTQNFGTVYIAGNPNKYACTITNKPVY